MGNLGKEFLFGRVDFEVTRQIGEGYQNLGEKTGLRTICSTGSLHLMPVQFICLLENDNLRNCVARSSYT